MYPVKDTSQIRIKRSYHEAGVVAQQAELSPASVSDTIQYPISDHWFTFQPLRFPSIFLLMYLRRQRKTPLPPMLETGMELQANGLAWISPQPPWPFGEQNSIQINLTLSATLPFKYTKKTLKDNKIKKKAAIIM